MKIPCLPTTALPPTIGRSVEHLFSVDVEEYFQVNAFGGLAARETWDRRESRVARFVDLLLELLERHSAHATFFTLGWIADRHPDVVRGIANAGHEIASHGWWHQPVTALTIEEFRADVRNSKRSLEDLVGAPVIGYRAPSFSIAPGSEWALDVLLEEGYCYDSSLFPVRRPGYGHPHAPVTPGWLRREGGVLLELPPTTLAIGSLRLPAAGGGYFRQFPYSVTRAAFRAMERRPARGMFYIHPWELDPGQPRLPVGFLTSVRHYRGLDRTRARLERLLGEFRFTSVARALMPDAPASPGRLSEPLAVESA